MFTQLKSASDIYFRKKNKLSSEGLKTEKNAWDVIRMGKDRFKDEYKSARDALWEFYPFSWRQQWLQIRNFTSAECESQWLLLRGEQTNMKCYSTVTFASLPAFNFGQRRYVTRKSYTSALGLCHGRRPGRLRQDLKVSRWANGQTLPRGRALSCHRIGHFRQRGPTWTRRCHPLLTASVEAQGPAGLIL